MNVSKSKIQTEIEAMLLMNVMHDMDEDSVDEIRNRNQWQLEKFNAVVGNFDSMRNFNDSLTAAFSTEVSMEQTNLQDSFTELNKRLKDSTRGYFWLYLFASLFVFADQVWNTKENET